LGAKDFEPSATFRSIATHTPDPALLAGFARRDSNLDKVIDMQFVLPCELQNLQFLVAQVLLVGRGTQVGDDFAHRNSPLSVNRKTEKK
jgi:hypothetical protein